MFAEGVEKGYFIKRLTVMYGNGICGNRYGHS